MSYTKEPLFGNYIGIVVNREDPEYRGRVQVWIPHLSNTLHTEWNDELKNKSFKHIHDSGSLDPKLIEELQNVLPWAECAAPIFGGGTSATFNQETGITDTNPIRTIVENAANGPSVDYGDELLIPFDGGNTPNTKGLNKEFTNRLNGLYKDLNDAGYYIGITSGARIGSSGAHNASLQNGAIAVDVRVRGNGKYGNININSIDGKNPAAADANNIDNPLFKQLLEKHNLHQPLHPQWGSVKGIPEKWHIEPIETRGGSRGYGLFSSVSNTLNKTSADFNQDSVTKTALDAAEIPGASVNPAATATSADRSVKDGYVQQDTNYDNSSIKNIHPNILRIMAGIGATESGFSEKEVSDSWKYDPSSYFKNGVKGPNNYKTDQASFQKINSGYYQTSLDMGNQFGISNINSGTFEEQTVKTAQFIQKQYPDLYNQAINGSGTSEELLDITKSMGRWYGPKDAPGKALTAIDSTAADPYAFFDQLNRTKTPTSLASDGTTVTGEYSPTLNPVPNFNPSVNNPMLAGDQPSGMFSIPNKGAKVFVFFLGGDIQKPVYFANLLEPETIKKMAGYGSDGFISGKEGTRDAGMLGSGPVSLTYSREDSIEQSGVPKSFASINLQAGGTGISSTPNNLELIGQGHCNFSIRGDLHQSADIKVGNFGSIYNTAEGDVKLTCGILGKKQQEASEKLKKLLNDVQKQKVEEITKNAKSGEPVACPLCSMDYATERASSYAKKATSLLRLLKIPYFSYAIDVFQFLLTMIFIPFVSIVKGQALGECGNPDCKGGKIPSPQKPIEEANKKAMETLVSKQKEIAELEQQLGNGGSYSVTAAKDIIINAGLTMNDAECFAKTVNKSEPVCLKGASKSTMHLGAAENLPGSVYCSPIQFPGGNVIIKGGNSVKIIAGSPGIEFITKGKLVFNSGSLEILTSNGEMVVGSTNHTTLKGKVVTIDAEDGSNGGGINLNAPNTLIKGLSVTGNAGIKGALKVEGELSCKYLNTVAQRLQSDMAGSPDQRIPFSNWAIGTCQTNDILNTIRTAITHYLMPGAILTLTNIIKFVMQCYNTILTNTVMEYAPTGLFFGLYCGPIYNWHHNQLEDPKPIHVDYITPKGIYFDDGSGVDSNSSDPGPVPTRARKNGMGMDGGPKSLAGCGGFGNWGNGNTTSKKGKLNSFGLGDVLGFQGTRLSDENVKFEYNKDGSIKVNINNSPC